jgi:hypothetical protein
LYKKLGILTPEERVEWRAQMILLRFGESSGTEEEEEEPECSTPVEKGIGTKRQNWTEEDGDEESTPLKIKQLKHTTGTRGVSPRIEEIVDPAPAKGKKPVTPPLPGPKVGTGMKIGPVRPLTSLERPLNDVASILSQVRADWEVKNSILNRIAELVSGKVDGTLPKTVANCISNPDEHRELKKWI